MNIIPKGYVSVGDNAWVRDPRIAMDARDSDERDEAHDAALEHAQSCSDEQLEELQGAIDKRRGATDRRARDGRRRAGDEERAKQVGETSARSVLDSRDERGRRRGRDAMPDPKDHRRDFRSGDTRERDEVFARARDSLATDSAGTADLDALFPQDGNGHPYANRRNGQDE